MRLDPARWDEIQRLFHAAADLPGPEQRAFLDASAPDDPGLIADVMALIDADARDASILSRAVAGTVGQVLGDTAPPAIPLQEFGPYRIISVLGEGGMGVVYLAERTDLGSMVAVKILRDAWLSPARRERFANEQRTLAQLNHPAIARLYDANTLADGTPWFVMEYVAGVPLTEYCRTREASLADRLRLFRAVCVAVQHAHVHAVIHRDLKPSNILVTADGTVKLLDFGIAKQLDLESKADQTQTGLRLMTPAYAAPEQVRGGRIGTTTDVYSLGVILYELLAGRLPFDLSQRTPDEARALITEEPPLRPSAAAKSGAGNGVSGVSRRSWADLDILCLTAMHQDPERRYGTVEALMRDIDHFCSGEPLEARPDSAGYRLGKFARRNWRPLSVTAAVVTLGVVLVVFYTVRLTQARNDAVAEASRTQRIQHFMMSLFQGGDQATGPADSLRVVTIVDRGVQEARILDADPEVQSELYQTLGTIYQALGNFPRADSLLLSALARRRARLGPDHPEVVASLVALGLLRVDQAQFEEGEKFIREGLNIGRRALPPGHPAIAKATEALGKVLEERGQYDSAIAVLEEAVRMSSGTGGSPATPELANSLTELANTHFYAGHYDASDSLNRIVLAMNGQFYGERHPKIAEGFINLGAAQSERGHYDRAERFYRKALDITQAWYGKDSYETASNMTSLGRSLVYQNKFDEATPLLEEALAIQERVFGPVHPRVASALNELGSVALQTDHFDQAEAYYKRMAAIYKEVYHDNHYLIGIALSNLATVYMGRKDFPKAERAYRETVAIFEKTQGPAHLNTGIARIKLGRSLLRQNRYAEGEKETLAGYEILSKEANPQVSFLTAARKDLIADYEGMKQPDKAARFKAELAQLSAGAGSPPKK
ncbi:MAG TPA: serine/threonine-protein kinase [Gemmatimonadales bacterium]|nr:serine/threonine-protein kinase [Gemmatimonadales bacterium]